MYKFLCNRGWTITLLPCSFALTFRSRLSGHTDNGHRDVIVVSFLRVDDVSATPDLVEGQPTDLPRLPTPPPPPGSYSNLHGLPAALPVRLRSFHDRPAPQLNAILPPALPTGAHVRNQTRSNALITIFVRKRGSVVWTKTVVFEAVCFY